MTLKAMGWDDMAMVLLLPFALWTCGMPACTSFSSDLKAWQELQRSAKKYANLAKQDPGRARQNR